MKRALTAFFLVIVAISQASASYVPGVDTTVRTNTGNTATGVGAPTDSAWSGSGSGSAVSILKAIWAAVRMPSGTPSPSAVTQIDSATPQTVFSQGSRSFFRIANLNSIGGYDLGCTDDGTTPSATNFTIRVYAAGFYEASKPQFVSSDAIQCIGVGGTVTLKGVQF